MRIIHSTSEKDTFFHFENGFIKFLSLPFSVKYLKGKPVQDITGDLFLRLTTAEEDGLIQMKIGELIKGLTHVNYVEEVKQLYIKVNILSLE